jgi:Uncharacterized conserved protein
MADVLFKKVDYTLKKLLEDIAIGDIALPDLQRPFVWSPARVRDLFDSMYRGYPIGHLLFWENGGPEHHHIGTDRKQKVPRLLVVDGQQRLTAAYAVVKGVPVVGKDFRPRRIRIAFHPLREEFEVTGAAIERDPSWIPDISVFWREDGHLISLAHGFVGRLRQTRELSEREERRIESALERLWKILDYPLTALEVSSTVDEEQVGEIFVRINSKGRKLSQADFILTLMSVHWDEGRRALEGFCRRAREPLDGRTASPANPVFQPTADRLLRVSVALGFRRARLRYVYSILRGKDLVTGDLSVERREEQFRRLSEAQEATLDLTNWHEFLEVVAAAGFVRRGIIASEMALLFTYALWLMGRRDARLDHLTLRRLMARWLFMSLMTSRYTGSSETRMEQDLALLRGVGSPDAFVRVLEDQMAMALTNDYWQVTLPQELRKSAAFSPAECAFIAALCILDAPVLYSSLTVRQLLDPGVLPAKKHLERHHLFPKAWLRRRGITGRRLVNQAANFALLEWPDNLSISDRPPAEYAPLMEQHWDPARLGEMYRSHALPDRWYEMEYETFLAERARRMAAVIREAFTRLGAPA